MKYVVIVGDGMPDLPLNELQGKTPLEAASTPNMDFIASNGFCGVANFIPETLPPGSDVANLSLFGYDPLKYFTGRGPLEAASMGVELKKDDVAFRMNLVNLENGVMNSYSAGHISTADAREIINELNIGLSSHDINFYPGVSYRHLCVIKNGPEFVQCTPPHDISGKKIEHFLPKGEGAEILSGLIKKSWKLLSGSRVNKKRIASGLLSASSIWLWGQGRKPQMPNYDELYDLSGSVITAVDLIKGIGVYAGLDIINVPGATGYVDTNYMGKAQYALESLKLKDYVFIHVESPDEAGHMGNIELKIKAIEDFDKFVVGTILEGLKDFEDSRILVTSDHQTPIPMKTHARGPVPFAILGKSFKRNGPKKFCEKDISKTKIDIKEGFTLIPEFLKKQ